MNKMITSAQVNEGEAVSAKMMGLNILRSESWQTANLRSQMGRLGLPSKSFGSMRYCDCIIYCC